LHFTKGSPATCWSANSAGSAEQHGRHRTARELIDVAEERLECFLRDTKAGFVQGIDQDTHRAGLPPS
jgi:hypothetical protein